MIKDKIERYINKTGVIKTPAYFIKDIFISIINLIEKYYQDFLSYKDKFSYKNEYKIHFKTSRKNNFSPTLFFGNYKKLLINGVEGYITLFDAISPTQMFTVIYDDIDFEGNIKYLANASLTYLDISELPIDYQQKILGIIWDKDYVKLTEPLKCGPLKIPEGFVSYTVGRPLLDLNKIDLSNMEILNVPKEYNVDFPYSLLNIKEINNSGVLCISLQDAKNTIKFSGSGKIKFKYISNSKYKNGERYMINAYNGPLINLPRTALINHVKRDNKPTMPNLEYISYEGLSIDKWYSTFFSNSINKVKTLELFCLDLSNFNIDDIKKLSNVDVLIPKGIIIPEQIRNKADTLELNFKEIEYSSGINDVYYDVDKYLRFIHYTYNYNINNIELFNSIGKIKIINDQSYITKYDNTLDCFTSNPKLYEGVTTTTILEEALLDVDGKINTDNILKETLDEINDNTIISFIQNHYFETANYGNHKGYIPALGELVTMKNVFYNFTYVSSTQYDENHMWAYCSNKTPSCFPIEKTSKCVVITIINPNDIIYG